MSKIFISYRREDSKWPVDRIHAALKPHVANPATDIFVDLDNIPVGVDFASYLDAKVSECDVLLAVIGPDWLTVQNPRTGKRRLDEPKDFVRIEIAAALKRNIPVAPVLLDGVHLPDPEDLPEDLRPLVGRQGVEVSRANFDADVQRLIVGLGLNKRQHHLHQQAPAAATYAPKPESPKGNPAPLIALVVLLLAAGGVGAYGFSQGWFNGEINTAGADETPGGTRTGSADAGESAAWNMANGLKSPEAYRSYLASFPDGAHAADAKTALEGLVDEADWNKASGGSRDQLNGYLATHPSGAHVEDARTQLAALDESERAAAAARSEAERREIERRAAEQRENERRAADRRADENAWAIASGANTAAGYRAYLSSYPSGAYASTARTRISNLDKPSSFDTAQLHPDVRAAAETARQTDRNAQAKAAEGRAAATRADEAAARARSGDPNARVETFDNQRIEVEVQNGQRQGYGVLYHTVGANAGDIYRGQWRANVNVGLGIYSYGTSKIALIYEGEFVASTFNGLGVYTWRDGETYSGRWTDGLRTGSGISKLASGYRYDGEWAGDKRNGFGVEWAPGGTVARAGRWKDGSLVETLTK